MTRHGHNFPRAHDLPLPADAQPDSSWTANMVEMADHIGASAVLRLVDRFGGMRIYIPADWARGKVYEGKGSIREVIGDKAARILSDVYRREFILVPTAKAALRRARRAAVIAAVKAGDISGAEAARILETSRPYMSFLVNQSDEGDPATAPAGRRVSNQLDMFGDGDE